MRDEMKECIPEQTSRRETQEHFEQVLVLVRVWLHRDEEEDEEGGSADEQSGSNGLRAGKKERKKETCRKAMVFS